MNKEKPVRYLNDEEQHKKFLEAYKDTKNKHSLINIRALSRRVTGSPYKIRHDFVPDEHVKLVSDIDRAITEVLIKYKI